MADPWRVEHLRATPAELHGRQVDGVRSLAVLEATSPALVLGSTQRPGDVDDEVARRLGVDVVTRRSGGGAVLVEPGGVVWIDVVLPRADPRWDDDVGRAAWWVGEAWAAALVEAGVAGAEVHRGPMVRTALSRQVCFAGLGPGEVTAEGAKVVGIAQRRTRHLAWFQCAAPLRWDPEPLGRLLGVDATTVRVRPLGGLDADSVIPRVLGALTRT